MSGDGFSNVAVLGPAVDTVSQFADGNILGGLAGVANTVGGAASMIADPIAALGSSVASFLLDYMPPLPELLNMIAGNPDEVGGMSSVFASRASQLEAEATALEAEMDLVLADWSGAAAEAYRARMQERIQELRDLASTAEGLGTGYLVVSGVVEAVRSIVKTLISDLVGKLISFVSQTVFTFGLGATWAVPQSVASIAFYAEKVRQWTDSLTNGITNALRCIDTLNTILGNLAPTISSIIAGLLSGGQRVADGTP